MAFNEQRNKNKAKVWTVIVHILLMLWFAFYGLTYQDPPPPEEGIAINFGYEETGAGQNTQAAPTIPPPTPATPVKTPPVQEEVVTQDVEDARSEALTSADTAAVGLAFRTLLSHRSADEPHAYELNVGNDSPLVLLEQILGFEVAELGH